MSVSLRRLAFWLKSFPTPGMFMIPATPARAS
jgi:hypothetical protein